MFMLFFVKQKTAYELRISDWSSDVCSSDLPSRGSWFKKRSQHPGRLFVDSQSLREKVGSSFIACLVRDWKQGPRGACDSFMPGHEPGNHVDCLGRNRRELVQRRTDNRLRMRHSPCVPHRVTSPSNTDE